MDLLKNHYLATHYHIQKLLYYFSLKLTQEEFSKKSGVSFGSIKRFENTGEISLFSLIKIAIILDCEDEFLNLFQQKQYNSIEEIINEQD